MRKLLKVWPATVLAQSFLLAAAPAEAADGVLLVGCDLFARNGPRVEFVQSHGVARRDGDTIRRRFFSSPDFRSADFEGRDCAEILAEVIDDGLEFQAMDVFGQDSDLALWFSRDWAVRRQHLDEPAAPGTRRRLRRDPGIGAVHGGPRRTRRRVHLRSNPRTCKPGTPSRAHITALGR